RNLPNFCWCENPNCHSGQIHLPGSRDPKMTCIKCAFDTCFIHRLKWDEGNQPVQHNATTCKDFHIYSSEVAAIRKMTEACPNCGVRAEKDGGCKGMHCKSRSRT
ncbi:hypothetical protein DL95DRAFT_282541, partial [Leptodontidium sp. 2 PMI_412]